METVQTNYQDIKISIRGQLNSVAESFVIIGYQLKQIRDNELFKEDGYKDIFEFAQEEFNLGKSNASRFMGINDKFSIDGNSPELIEEYRDYGSSKLAEMLTLSEEELKLISDRTTRAEIREIKQMKNEAVAPAQQTSETIDFTQSKDDLSMIKNEEKTDIENVVVELFRDEQRREMLKEVSKIDIHKISSYSLQSELANIVNPSEHYVFKKGFIIAVFENVDTGIKINRFGQATNSYTYSHLYDAIRNIFELTSPDPWVEFYGESEKVNTLTVVDNQEDEEVNEGDNEEDNEDDEQPPKEVKKQDKKVEIKKTTNVVEENIPVKQKIEDYPEYLPEGNKKDEDRIEIPQNNTDSRENKEVKEVVHELKIASMFFVEVLNKTKRFELRKFDRDFKVGDILKFLEYGNGEYTDRQLITKIIYILSDYTGLTEGYCILGLGEIYEN